MRHLIGLGIVAAGFTAAVCSAQVDPKEIVRHSIQNYERDWRASRDSFTYTQKDITEADGKRTIEVSEIMPLDGTPYERLISKDGHPLDPDEQRKEQKKYEHALHQREKETPAEHEDRIRKYEHEREFVKDIPEAYSYKLIGDESVEGRPAWVITMTPQPGFVPAAPHASLLEHISGKLWIDKEDCQWAKAEAHVSDTISIGWILARVEPGTSFTLEQTRVENNIWMPKRITISGSAHVMLVHTKNINEELLYSGYRKDNAVSAHKRAAGISPAVAQSFQ